MDAGGSTGDTPLAPLLAAIGPRPDGPDARRAAKKNWSEQLSHALAQLFADRLRPDFPGVLPDEQGRFRESRARTGKGVKKLDVNFSTPQLGLGLGVSIKTLNFRDARSRRYTKNFTRIDNELRAEAKDYHERQPYAVLAGVVFLPEDAAEDGHDEVPSSFGKSIQVFRHRAGRTAPRDEEERFELVVVGLYAASGAVRFFDVMDAPPRQGPPEIPPAFDLDELLRRIDRVYRERNGDTFRWAGDPPVA